MGISLSTFGQENVRKTHKRLIGVIVSPDICHRTLKNDGSSSMAAMIMNTRNDRESPKFGYSSGFSFCYNHSNRWSTEIGLQYSNKGFKSVMSDLIYGDPIDPRFGFTYQQGSFSSPTEITFVDNFHYLDIPIRKILCLGNGKFRFITSVGFTTNILIQATTTTIRKFESEDTKHSTRVQGEDYNTINFSPTASIGIDWQLCNKFNLRVEPTFRNGLLKIIDAPITAYLWSGGLNFTCYYALK